MAGRVYERESNERVDLRESARSSQIRDRSEGKRLVLH